MTIPVVQEVRRLAAWIRAVDLKGVEPGLWSFAAITDDNLPEVAAVGHGRTVLDIKPEHLEQWLTQTPTIWHRCTPFLMIERGRFTSTRKLPDAGTSTQGESMTTVLDVNDQESKLLRDYLLKHPVLNSGLEPFPDASYGRTGLLQVPIKPMQGAQINQCWDNVRIAEGEGLGKAVFGWALWKDIFPSSVAAQHHAVIVTPEGELVCISPHEPELHISEITFFADERVPYNYEDDLAPAMLLKNLNPTKKFPVVHVWIGLDEKPIRGGLLHHLASDNYGHIRMKR